MKLLIGLATAAGLLAYLTIITPASAQKDPACTEKCNRENKGYRRACQSLHCSLPARSERQSKMRCNC